MWCIKPYDPWLTKSSLCRNQGVQESLSHPTQVDPHVRFNLESKDHNLSFKDLARGTGTELEDLEGAVSGPHQHVREPSSQWGSATSPNNNSATAVAGVEDQNAAYPYLPTVLEEPSSSVSEGSIYCCATFSKLPLSFWRIFFFWLFSLKDLYLFHKVHDRLTRMRTGNKKADRCSKIHTHTRKKKKNTFARFSLN